MATVIAGIVAIAWKTSAEREYRYRMPDPGRFFPSRSMFFFLSFFPSVPFGWLVGWSVEWGIGDGANGGGDRLVEADPGL